jgi:hypothetical protein
MGTLDPFRSNASRATDQLSCLLINRAPALEVLVELGYGEHALAGNIASPQHILKKGNDLCMRLRTSERNHQNGIVVHMQSLARE